MKKAENRELRRAVVGQVLDYAAALRNASATKIRAEYEARLGSSSESDLESFLGERDTESFWSDVADKVSDGKIRMVFAADEIPANLQAVIEYLNEQLRSAEVFGLSVTQYIGPSEERVLVPRLIGATAKARSTKSVSQGGQGSKGTYEERLAQADDAGRRAAVMLEDWAVSNGISFDGNSGRMFRGNDGGTICRLYLEPTPKRSLLQVELKSIRNLGANQEADELLRRIRELNVEAYDTLPSIFCDELVAHWSDCEAILNDLYELRSKLTG